MTDNINIPKDLESAFAELNKILPPHDIKTIKKGTEDDTNKYHHSLGRGMRNNWMLWEGTNELCMYFHKLGITHADDISGIILTSYYRHLHNQSLDIKEQVKIYLDYWKMQQQGN